MFHDNQIYTSQQGNSYYLYPSGGWWSIYPPGVLDYKTTDKITIGDKGFDYATITQPYSDWDPPNIPLPEDFQHPIKEYGWICPKCGQVNAPFVRECPCSINYNITCKGE